MLKRLLIALPLVFSLAACDQLQQKLLGEDPAVKAAKQEGEGKAVGAACRQSGRAIEDCYAIYHWLPKAAIFSGWQDMDAYMRSNKIDTVEPQLPPPLAPGAKPRAEDKSEKTPDKGDEKSDKH